MRIRPSSDLLYSLSRFGQEPRPRLVLISANHPDLSTELDDRIYSSLLPATVYLEPYTEDMTVDILAARSADIVDRPVTDDALARIAAATPNIRLGRHWLHLAAEITDGTITDNVVRLTKRNAVQRYRHRLLTPFSKHHRLLMDALVLITADTEPVQSGTVYTWYEKLCTHSGTDPEVLEEGFAGVDEQFEGLDFDVAVSPSLVEKPPADAVEEYLADLERDNVQGTVDTHQSRLTFFVAWCEENDVTSLAELNGQYIKDFRDWRRAESEWAVTTEASRIMRGRGTATLFSNSGTARIRGRG